MSEMAVEYRIRPISVGEYHRMGELGIIKPDERVELLDGELIAMPPIGPRHGFSVRMLLRLFSARLADRAIVDVQAAVTLDDYSEPQPDVMLLALREDFYRHALPRADAPLLVVEVSESTLRYDRGRKLGAYARAGVREVWIVDLVDDRIEAFSGLREGEYCEVRTALRGESLAPSAFPEVAFAVDDILG
jgi:Uma2 family endonuclease